MTTQDEVALDNLADRIKTEPEILRKAIRPHWALRPAPGADPMTPHEVYAGGAEVIIPAWHHWTRAAKKKLDQMMTADAQSQAA